MRCGRFPGRAMCPPSDSLNKHKTRRLSPTGFSLVKKRRSLFLTKRLQSGRAKFCPPSADKIHTPGLRCIFPESRGSREKFYNPFRACGREFYEVLLTVSAVSPDQLKLPRVFPLRTWK